MSSYKQTYILNSNCLFSVFVHTVVFATHWPLLELYYFCLEKVQKVQKSNF